MRSLKRPHAPLQFNGMDPTLISLTWEEDRDAFGGEETDGIYLSYDVINAVVELQERMRIAIKAIQFHGSATGRLEKKRPRVKLQQEHRGVRGQRVQRF